MYLHGALQLQSAFNPIEFSVAVGTYLAINRQTVTDRFLASRCSHLLMVDGDIGFGRAAVQKLLEVNVPMVSGMYLQRNGEAIVPAEVIETGGADHDVLLDCFCVPAGFLLLQRELLERIRDAQPTDPIWSMSYGPAGYVGEDVHFCRKVRSLGENCWLHPLVMVDHVGEVVFKLPKEGVAMPRFKR